LIAEYFQTTVGAFGNSPHIALLLAIMMTAILAQFVTNYGAATIMFSIVMPVAELLELSPYPFVFGLMAGAGCNFLTPIAYQTNLMVYGPGGYRFTDFIRLGLPLLVIVISCALLMIPLFFPFSI
jgi:di/tricarboxylate transporter